MDGVVEFGFASQKKTITIYGLELDVLEAHHTEFVGAGIGKGCIRYVKPETIDLEAVARLLRTTAASSGKIC